MTIRSKIRPEDVVSIAARLRALRATTGMSQQKFADTYGFGYGQWANLESARSRIGIDTALVLVQRLCVTLDWIYLGDEYRLPAGLREEIQAHLSELPSGLHDNFVRAEAARKKTTQKTA